MIEDYWRSDDLLALREELRRWEGAAARVHTLTISHPQLRIWLWRPGVEVRLELMCVGPQYYSGPLSWHDSLVEVVPVACEHRREHEVEYELQDPRAQVVVRCFQVHAWRETAEYWQSQKD